MPVYEMAAFIRGRSTPALRAQAGGPVKRGDVALGSVG
jgi:hypothetical protein